MFLWAALALKDLVKGLLARNGHAKLQQRLEDLQSGLDELFAQLLGKVDKADQEHAATYILIEQDYSRHVQFHQKLTILGIVFACEYKLSEELKEQILAEQQGSIASKATVKHLFERLYDLGLFVNSACAGLLDVDLGFNRQIYPTSDIELQISAKPLAAVPSLSPLAELCYTFQV